MSTLPKGIPCFVTEADDLGPHGGELEGVCGYRPFPIVLCGVHAKQLRSSGATVVPCGCLVCSPVPSSVPVEWTR